MRSVEPATQPARALSVEPGVAFGGPTLASDVGGAYSLKITFSVHANRVRLKSLWSSQLRDMVAWIR